MRVLNVEKIYSEIDTNDLSRVSDFLDKTESTDNIDEINWDSNLGSPEVKFSICYSDKEIFLKYYVREDCVKAEMTESNQKVYEDSCVEFFVIPGDDGLYYNFEFNSIGTCLMAVGKDRNNRTIADPETISMIRRLPSIGIEPFPEIFKPTSWTLTLAIPLEVFFRHNVKDLTNKAFRANFYKCGDKLSTPHYLTWNPIKTKKPDYHCPEFFGEIIFD